MLSEVNKECTLLLNDGTVFSGYTPVTAKTATGEICFNTGMTGYQEIFTDPSYAGQIVVATHVHIGNYGTHLLENESSKIQIAALVCSSFSSFYSRNGAEGSLLDFFEKQGVPVIEGVDTRALVRHIRSKGAMNAIVSSETNDVNSLQKQLAQVPPMEGMELSSQVSTTTAYESGNPEAPFRVALLDLGVKQQIVKCLTDRGCYVKVFPAKTSFAEMERFAPNGYLASNGPGDPSTMSYAVETVGEILQSGKPFFGICLGHQVFAKAMGVNTYKMFNGHRGINHPVFNVISGKGEITSQNHGFAVKAEDLVNHPNLEVTHIHLNDQTIAGIRHRNGKAFSVQYHPEAGPGPHDSRYLFDQFIVMMEKAGLKEAALTN
ncbi:MAG: glutamine-hydrolyzing carbamoyl-phosphate synthase small subunit [Bacteroidia bacterium]|nr:glutamine-hydrolyzing carbamoyl-phosphate synthase small subunit [Bacteroidia bacterium]